MKKPVSYPATSGQAHFLIHLNIRSAGKEKNASFYSGALDSLSDSNNISFDTEEHESEQITMDGIVYTYYKSIDNYNGLIWNFGGNIYYISGNISLDEALNVAKSTRRCNIICAKCRIKIFF